MGQNYAQAWVFVYPWLMQTSVRTATTSPASQCQPASNTNAPTELLNNVELATADDLEISTVWTKETKIITIIT